LGTWKRVSGDRRGGRDVVGHGRKGIAKVTGNYNCYHPFSLETGVIGHGREEWSEVRWWLVVGGRELGTFVALGCSSRVQGPRPESRIETCRS
jgi:hypothetical protein